MESHMYSICQETVDALGFAAIGRDMPYEVIHHDNLESVLGLSGHDGTVLQTISYDPFGNITSQSSSNNNQLHYTGREQDPDTGLYNDRIRIYDPITGRFISEDPMGFKAGVNFYVYVHNNPINANDPYGLFDLIYDNTTNTLSLINRDGYNIGTYTAYNNVQHNKQPWPAGIYEYERHTTHSNDAPDSSFGSNGNFIFTVPGQPLLGVHSGQEDVPDALGRTGPQHCTFGCIRSTDDATAQIQSQINSGDPLETISVIRQTNPVQGPPAPGTDWNGFPIAPGSPVVGPLTPMPSQSSSVSPSSMNMSDESAAGGYLIYPNKPNTNMMRSVYSK